MLTRKHYKAIAEAIGGHTCVSLLDDIHIVIAKEDFIDTLCHILKVDNPNSNSGKFKEACR